MDTVGWRRNSCTISPCCLPWSTLAMPPTGTRSFARQQKELGYLQVIRFFGLFFCLLSLARPLVGFGEAPNLCFCRYRRRSPQPRPHHLCAAHGARGLHGPRGTGKPAPRVHVRLSPVQPGGMRGAGPVASGNFHPWRSELASLRLVVTPRDSSRGSAQSATRLGPDLGVE